ncbi:hypothetical protein ACQQ2N_15855 [Dokdonella sp. MW10]|uniref:hypothetical protein n=1 Tax=Dokdonella sp. MW10 TaxID=2992926 RepID=UPI003F7CF501
MSLLAFEPHLLGYRIERTTDTEDAPYQVFAPDDTGELARFRDRPSAEQFIVMRELRAIETRPRHPAY